MFWRRRAFNLVSLKGLHCLFVASGLFVSVLKHISPHPETTTTYSRVPIRRGVRNKRSGTQDEKCIGWNISHMCLGLYSRCRYIVTNLHLKVLHFDILIQLKGTAHFLENVLGLIKGVCRINVPCLLIGTRE